MVASTAEWGKLLIAEFCAGVHQHKATSNQQRQQIVISPRATHTRFKNVFSFTCRPVVQQVWVFGGGHSSGVAAAVLGPVLVLSAPQNSDLKLGGIFCSSSVPSLHAPISPPKHSKHSSVLSSVLLVQYPCHVKVFLRREVCFDS